MTCPDPTTGAATASALLAPVDAYAYDDGQPFQGQLVSIATDKPNACARFRANQINASEVRLRILQLKAWPGDPSNFTPLAYLTGTFPVGSDAAQPDGSIRRLFAYHTTYGHNCTSYKDNAATAGSVVWTTVTYATPGDPASPVTLAEGTFDLTFPAGHVTGSWSAPVCAYGLAAGCADRPASCTTV